MTLETIKREIENITKKIRWIEMHDLYDVFDVYTLENKLEELKNIRGQLEAMKI